MFPSPLKGGSSGAPPGIVKCFFELLHFLIIQEALAALRHDQRSHVLPASGSGDLGSLAIRGDLWRSQLTLTRPGYVKIANWNRWTIYTGYVPMKNCDVQ